MRIGRKVISSNFNSISIALSKKTFFFFMGGGGEALKKKNKNK